MGETLEGVLTTTMEASIVDGGGYENDAAPALFLHMWDYAFSEQKRSSQIQVDRLLKLREVDIP